MKQLDHLTLKGDEARRHYFRRAQEIPNCLEEAGEHLSEPLPNAMVLKGLLERYENFFGAKKLQSSW